MIRSCEVHEAEFDQRDVQLFPPPRDNRSGSELLRDGQMQASLGKLPCHGRYGIPLHWKCCESDLMLLQRSPVAPQALREAGLDLQTEFIDGRHWDVVLGLLRLAHEPVRSLLVLGFD